SELADLQLNRALLHEYETESAAGPSGTHEDRLRAAGESLRQSLARLKELTADNAAQQERLEQLEPLLEQHIQNILGTAAGAADQAGGGGRGGGPSGHRRGRGPPRD